MLSILQQSWSSLVLARKHVLIGAVVFAAIYTTIVSHALDAMEREQAKSAKLLGVDPARIESLLAATEEGSPDAAELIMIELQRTSSQFAQMSESEREELLEQHSFELLKRIIPVIAYAAIALSLVMYIALLYYLQSMLASKKSVGELIKRTVAIAVPCIGLLFWILLRSHSWIILLSIVPYGVLFGVAGLLCAIIFLPLYMVVPVVYLKGKKETIQSATEKGYAMSKGHWGQIAGSTIVVMLLMGFVQLLAIRVFAYLPDIQLLLSTVVRQFTCAFFAAFLVQLHASLSKK